MKPSVTPLRYPGGKTWLLDYAKRFVGFHKIENCVIAEPYAGSASISVGLLHSHLVKEAYINEKDPLLVAFWKAILDHNEELAEYVSSLEVSMDTWFSFRGFLTPGQHKVIELAGAFLFYNRTNYSGIIKGGPLGGKHQESPYKIYCRFNQKKIVDKIRSLSTLKGRLHITEGDGIEFMKRLEATDPGNLFFYVDPPYYIAGKDLYRYFFTDAEHQKLASFLKSLESPWILSYDNAEFIRNLYADNESSPVYTDYQSGHFKKDVKELLISNRFIPPFTPEVSLKPRNVRNDKLPPDEIEV